MHVLAMHQCMLSTRASAVKRPNLRTSHIEQARKVGAARVTQCAASSVSQASGKRSAEFGIDVKAEPQSKSHVQLTVTLPPQLVKTAYDKALNSIKKEVDLPGYRKGSKVPGLRS